MKKSLPPLLHKTRPQSACSADTQHNELPAARKLKGLKNTDHIQGDLSLSLLQTRLDLLESTCSRLKIELRQKDAKLTDAVKCQNDLAKTVESLEFRFEFLCSKVNAIEGRACSASTMSSEASFLYPCENNAANLLLNRATEYIFPGDGDSVNSSGFPYDIRIFLQRIKELNQIAGEGISIVTVVDGTSRLKTPEKLTLSLYKNGIILQNGAFRDYKDPSAKLLMKDIMDGFFPYELKDLHPEGVPFVVRDFHEEEYNGDKKIKYTPFGGRGRTLICPPPESDQSLDHFPPPSPLKSTDNVEPCTSDRAISTEPAPSIHALKKQQSGRRHRVKTVSSKSRADYPELRITTTTDSDPPRIKMHEPEINHEAFVSSSLSANRDIYLVTSGEEGGKTNLHKLMVSREPSFITNNESQTVQIRVKHTVINGEAADWIVVVPCSWTESMLLKALVDRVEGEGEWRLIALRPNKVSGYVLHEVHALSSECLLNECYHFIKK